MVTAWLCGSSSFSILSHLLIAFYMAVPIYIFINMQNFPFIHILTDILCFLNIHWLVYSFVYFYFIVLGVKFRALYMIMTKHTIELWSTYLNFNNIHPEMCYVKSHYSLIYISLMISDIHNFSLKFKSFIHFEWIVAYKIRGNFILLNIETRAF